MIPMINFQKILLYLKKWLNLEQEKQFLLILMKISNLISLLLVMMAMKFYLNQFNLQISATLKQ